MTGRDEDEDAPAEFASPPCYMHEIDPVYMGLAPAPDDQAVRDVMRWRKATRTRLLANRQAIPAKERRTYTKKIIAGIWDIPTPVSGPETLPDVVIAPVVGFDSAGYRLGYGGGFFDRTLAALERRPRAIGIGYEQARLPTIYPQPHDIAMTAMVTEAGTVFP